MNAITTVQLEASINLYRQQSTAISQRLLELENQKRDGLNAVQQLSGAIQACEALIQTIKSADEADAKTAEAKKVADAALPVPAGLPTPDMTDEQQNAANAVPAPASDNA